MEQYQQIIEDSVEPVLTLFLNRKSGNIPKGTYRYLEYYCTDSCDCRRVVIVVFNEKMKQKAVIDFGFDQDSAFSGPYLDQSNRQSPYAEQLLEYFVDALNSSPMWLERLYRHYRQVREKVDGTPYRGKPFPKPGELVYRLMPPPDLEAEILQSLKNLRREGAPSEPVRSRAPSSPGEAAAAHAKVEQSISGLVTRYAALGGAGPVEKLLTLQKELRRYLLEKEDSGGELAAFLPELCRQSPQDDERIRAALRLLFDALNLLDEELETGREDAKRRMIALQEALAQQVYLENEDLDLAAAVSNILVQSRIDIVPALRKATTRMMVDAARRTDLHDVPGEEIMTGIARSLDSMGVTSPFEAADEMLQLFTLNEPEMQVALIGEMLGAEKTLLRELSALMLFHPEPEVRGGVSQLLAELDGALVTPETLRRLIVSRNWLPEQLRKNLDRAVTGARKARVECAPLSRPESLMVYASSIDGAGEQLFQVLVSEGERLSRCAVTLKQDIGVTEVHVLPVGTKAEGAGFLALLKKEARFMESSAEHMDLRICHALADGSRSGGVPSHWLVRVAELMGRDRWRGIAFDPARELLQLWEELDSHDPRLLDEKEYQSSLQASGGWQLSGSFLSSWFENDDEVGRELQASTKKRTIDREAAVQFLLQGPQERRRRRWLERMAATALLLKSCRSPPVPWHQMFHTAQAVADETTPLTDIPLMVKIAEATVDAHVAAATRETFP